MLKRVVMVLITAIVLSSCQTMSKEECAVADWRVVGEQDGAAGYEPQSRFARHVKACERAGVLADQTLWYQGYQQGLPRYCTPLNGLSVGRDGKSYANVCPVDLDAGFREGYSLGQAYYRKSSDIRSAESQIRSLEQAIRTDQDLIAKGQVDQREAERRIDNNRWKIRDLEREIGRMQSELRQIEVDMEDFRNRTVLRG
ncbi:Protein of unknown function (DUF2799) [Hoeflea phototrophica DFL-43]|jgi:hypothetical protein|uniref:ATPase involved in DNA repair n=1 Tax=Hoeflea phototrophica (strain DSM 17068 / NCIMB 14078 / DFL-43) TaxID=411684 RepID=A9D2C4_HOEPD|nr:DUF2799 domain-containing protein [Hoeflea phototrophica]EDQ34177.2 Protein of unknown function (DUF2799) [Hoeflea phototrophica DFL-43]